MLKTKIRPVSCFCWRAATKLSVSWKFSECCASCGHSEPSTAPKVL